MAKRTTTPALMLPVREPGIPAHRWLGTALRAEILEGRLRPGARLPATRELASQYGLSRGTIVGAFEQLKAEGYLEGTVGSGTYVNAVLPDELLQVALKAGPARPVRQAARRDLSAFGERARPVPPYTFGAPRAFRANQPALALFPTALWAQVAARRLRRASANLLLGCDPLGYRPLQAAVAEVLRTSRGVKCAPEQIAIVSGVQEALDLAARLLLDPGDRVCMEEPGYVGATAVFEACGARIVPVPVDAEGMAVPPAKARGAR